MHAWRSFLLRCFGAKIGVHVHIYPGARIWAPWNLECDDYASIAEDAVIYNAATLFMSSHAIVSQQAYICTATHDIDDPAFRMIAAPIRLGRYSWVCARQRAARRDARRGRGARARGRGERRISNRGIARVRAIPPNESNNDDGSVRTSRWQADHAAARALFRRRAR